MPPTVVTARAYAKINLALAVGPPLSAHAGPKAGFHPICSWFHAIDLWEDLEVRRLEDPGAKSIYEISWAPDAPRPTPIDWPIEKDLAVRAHRLLEAHTGRALPLAMKLHKRVPVGGGLGGGSSDAAAMLRAVNLLFDLGFSDTILLELSLKLGSDVAFFVDGELHAPPRPAIVSGLGEQLDRLPGVAGDLRLIIPHFGCPTGAVYKAFDAAEPAPLRDDEIRRLAIDAAATGTIDAAALFNDLAPAAEAVAPGLRELRRGAESALGTRVHLTGSGSTLFVLGDTIAQTPGARATLELKGNALTIVPTRLC